MENSKVAAILARLRSARKNELITVATKLTGCDILDQFRQFTTPVKIADLTCEQLRWLIEKELKSSDLKIDITFTYLKLDQIKINREECCICMDVMGRQKNSLPCGHWVHFKCFDQTGVPKCPMCRANLTEFAKSRRTFITRLSSEDAREVVRGYTSRAEDRREDLMGMTGPVEMTGMTGPSVDVIAFAEDFRSLKIQLDEQDRERSKKN